MTINQYFRESYNIIKPVKIWYGDFSCFGKEIFKEKIKKCIILVEKCLYDLY
jgi:hypothetical protein